MQSNICNQTRLIHTWRDNVTLAWVDTESSPWATVLRELTMFMKQKEISLHQMQSYICKLNTCNTHEDTTFPEVLSLGNCIEGRKEGKGKTKGKIRGQKIIIRPIWAPLCQDWEYPKISTLVLIGCVHTSYLSFFLHYHILRPENFTLKSA